MSIEKFLDSLGGQQNSEVGHFTLDPVKEKEILAQRSLLDPWQAWLALFQGFIRLSASRLELNFESQSVSIRAAFPSSLDLATLMAEPRFQLAWTNLDWFGQPSWHSDRSSLVLNWRGNLITRYQMNRNLKSLVARELGLCCIPILVNSKKLPPISLPSHKTVSAYPNLEEKKYAIAYPNPKFSKSPNNWRDFLPVDPNKIDSERLRAFAIKSSQSWSQVTWIDSGVIIKRERNTLERPGLHLFASVQSLDLKTDYSGFEMVRDDNYLEFNKMVKKDCLWML